MRNWMVLVLLQGALWGCTAASQSDENSDLRERSFLEKDQGKADSSSCSGVFVPDRGPFGKQIVLTFDDGPNLITTPKVLAVLRHYQIPATFFVNSKNVNSDAARELLREMVADPLFEVANHTHNHANMRTLSSTSVKRWVDETTKTLIAAGARPRYFRFPYGAANCSAMKIVRNRGYVAVGWHIDSADWCFAKDAGTCKRSVFRYVDDAFRSDMAGFVLSQVRSREGGILLFHDVHAYTADTLESIIQRLLSEGYRFAPIDTLAILPDLHAATPRFVGDSCVHDEDCAFSSGESQGFCHPAGFCTIPCEGLCPDQSGKASTFCVEDPDNGGHGICVATPVADNGHCALVPGSASVTLPRFVGSSGVNVNEKAVCQAN